MEQSALRTWVWRSCGFNWGKISKAYGIMFHEVALLVDTRTISKFYDKQLLQPLLPIFILWMGYYTGYCRRCNAINQISFWQYDFIKKLDDFIDGPISKRISPFGDLQIILLPTYVILDISKPQDMSLCAHVFGNQFFFYGCIHVMCMCIFVCLYSHIRNFTPILYDWHSNVHIGVSYTVAGPFRSQRIYMYLQTTNISRTLAGNKIVDNPDVVGASAVGAASTTSSFST